MANTVIQLRYSTVTGNVPTSLANGEISINSRDGKFFYSTPSGSIVTHYPYLGPAGLDTEIQFNDGGSFGGNANLTFDKSTSVLSVTGNINSTTVLNKQGQEDKKKSQIGTFVKATDPNARFFEWTGTGWKRGEQNKYYDQTPVDLATATTNFANLSLSTQNQPQNIAKN